MAEPFELPVMYSGKVQVHDHGTHLQFRVTGSQVESVEVWVDLSFVQAAALAAALRAFLAERSRA